MTFSLWYFNHTNTCQQVARADRWTEVGCFSLSLQQMFSAGRTSHRYTKIKSSVRKRQADRRVTPAAITSGSQHCHMLNEAGWASRSELLGGCWHAVAHFHRWCLSQRPVSFRLRLIYTHKSAWQSSHMLHRRGGCQDLHSTAQLFCWIPCLFWTNLIKCHLPLWVHTYSDGVLLPLPRRLCFHLHLFVCLPRNLVEGYGVVRQRSH